MRILTGQESALTIVSVGNNELGDRIREQREANNWSQGLIEARAGLTKGYLSLVESGKRTPKRDTMQRIANALRVPVQALEEGGSAPTEGSVTVYVDTNVLTAEIAQRMAPLTPDIEIEELQQALTVFAQLDGTEQRRILDIMEGMLLRQLQKLKAQEETQQQQENRGAS